MPPRRRPAASQCLTAWSLPPVITIGSAGSSAADCCARLGSAARAEITEIAASSTAKAARRRRAFETTKRRTDGVRLPRLVRAADAVTECALIRERPTKSARRVLRSLRLPSPWSSWAVPVAAVGPWRYISVSRCCQSMLFSTYSARLLRPKRLDRQPALLLQLRAALRAATRLETPGAAAEIGIDAVASNGGQSLAPISRRGSA